MHRRDIGTNADAPSQAHFHMGMRSHGQAVNVLSAPDARCRQGTKPCGACKFRPAHHYGGRIQAGTWLPLQAMAAWKPARYIEPPFPPAPPSMRKARSRQSSPRSLASCVELGVLERGLRGDRRWSASLHRFQQALLPWHLDSQAVCARAPLLTAAATLVARRHVIRTVRMGGSALAEHVAGQ